MKNLFGLAALVAAVAFTASDGHAANVSFRGQTSGGTGLFNGINWYNFSLDYNPASATTSGTVTTVTLDTTSFFDVFFGNFSKTFTMGPGLTTPVFIAPGSGTMSLDSANPNQIIITAAFTNTAAPSGQPTQGNLSMTVTGATDISDLSTTNVAKILRPGSNSTGSINGVVLAGGVTTNTIQLNGIIPVPEPGSIGLLTGLGCVVGRRLWRRRQQKQADAAV